MIQNELLRIESLLLLLYLKYSLTQQLISETMDIKYACIFNAPSFHFWCRALKLFVCQSQNSTGCQKFMFVACALLVSKVLLRKGVIIAGHVFKILTTIWQLPKIMQPAAIRAVRTKHHQMQLIHRGTFWSIFVLCNF